MHLGIIGLGLISYDLGKTEEIESATLNMTTTFLEIEIEFSDTEAGTGYANIEITPDSGTGNLSAYLCETSFDSITDIESNAIFFHKKEYRDDYNEITNRITISIDDSGTYYLYLVYEPYATEPDELDVTVTKNYWGEMFLIGFLMAIFAVGMFVACLVLYLATRK